MTVPAFTFSLLKINFILINQGFSIFPFLTLANYTALNQFTYLQMYKLFHCNRNLHHMVHWVLSDHTQCRTDQQDMVYTPHSSLLQMSYQTNHLDTAVV